MPFTARTGSALPFLLLSAFRTLIDELHARLADAGHEDVRPAHGVALQLINRGGGVSDLARRLGVSKQAASKTVAALEGLGYAERKPHAQDRRRTELVITAHGAAMLALSGEILDQLRDEWASVVGAHEMAVLEDALARLGGYDGLEGVVDWLGA